MSNEELNKKIEFTVEHQAKFAAEMEVMREVQAAESAARKEEDQKLSGALGGLIEIVGQVARHQMRTEDNVNSLMEAQMRTDEEINRLTQAQTETSQSLKILINVVERHIHGNGGAESPA